MKHVGAVSVLNKIGDRSHALEKELTTSYINPTASTRRIPHTLRIASVLCFLWSSLGVAPCQPVRFIVRARATHSRISAEQGFEVVAGKQCVELFVLR
jgi:hypothetical protein